MEAYNGRAIDFWNKLALGSNLFLLSQNEEDKDRLVASIVNTFNSPKRGNFNSNNSLIYVMSSAASPESLLEEIGGIKEYVKDKKLIFFVDLDKIWHSVAAADAEGQLEYKPELLALPLLAKDNVKLVFLQNDDMYYQFVQTPLIKKAYGNFIKALSELADRYCEEIVAEEDTDG